MRWGDFMALPIELALFFQSFRFQHMNAPTCMCFFLNMLTILQAVCFGLSVTHSIRPTFGCCFPNADSSMQELWTVGFANQRAFQKEVDHRNIALVEVNSNISVIYLFLEGSLVGEAYCTEFRR